MTKANKIFVGVLLGLAVFAGGLKVVNLRLDRILASQALAPELTGFPMTEQYSKRANLALAAASGARKPKSALVIVNLYYLSDQDLSKKLIVAGMSLHSVEKMKMTYACTPAYQGYVVVLVGTPSGGEPTVSLGGQEIKLTKSDGADGFFESLPDAQTRFHKEKQTGPAVSAVLPESNSRTFRAGGADAVSSVTVSPAPLYEKDIFANSRWIGSYAVWERQTDVSLSAITTNP